MVEADTDLGVQVLLPLQHGVERGGPRHVEHHQRSHRLPVIDTGHVPITLLSWDEWYIQSHTHTQNPNAHIHENTHFQIHEIKLIYLCNISDKCSVLVRIAAIM